MVAPRWLALCALLGVLGPGLAKAQFELVHPRCVPAWWDEETVAAALEVELGTLELDARITFVVDAPCRERTFVSVLVETPDGLRRRTIDVGDLPTSARPRAIGMGVAALLRGPPEPVSEFEPPPEAPDEPTQPSEREPTAEPEAPDESAPPPEREPTAAPGTSAVTRGRPPPAASRDSSAADALEPAEAAVEHTEDGTRDGGDAAGSPEGPGPWRLTVAATGLWTAPGAPWVGGHGSLGWRSGGWLLSLGVDGARANAHDPLGSVLGRWVSASASVRWSYEWQRVSLGARLGLTLDRTRLEGRSNQEGVHTRSRARWSAAAEATGTLDVALTRRLGVVLDLGLHLSPWGLGARSPTGRVLAMRGASGLLRLGLRVAL